MSSTIKFDVHNRFSGAVQFTAEIGCDESAERSVKLGLAARWAIGSRADLSGANLAGANLDGANLARANLAGANLDGANLARANLARANLAGANLAGANLARANLAGAYLAGADLSRANLSRADLYGANLDGAYLAGANLDGANLAGAYLAGAYLDGANLAGAYLDGALRCGGTIQWWWIAGPQGSRKGSAIAMWIASVGLRWTIGCRADCTTDEFRSAIAADHCGTDHEADYLHLIECVERHPGLKRAMAAHPIKVVEAAE